MDDLQPELVVEDTRRLIDTLALGPVDLLGFSTGGRAATAFVQHHPDRVRRLVLASTSPIVAIAIDGPKGDGKALAKQRGPARGQNRP